MKANKSNTIIEDKRITILVGHYGSGKTELSINFVRYLKQKGKENVALIDLDVINPYFKSGEKKETLTNLGVKVVLPDYYLSSVDLPLISPLVKSIITDSGTSCVFDIGGDGAGAIVLGCFSDLLRLAGAHVQCFMVVNVMRERTRTENGIRSVLNQLTKSSHIEINGLINNTNLSYMTDSDMIVNAQYILDDLFDRTGIPTVLITGEASVLDMLPERMKPLCFTIERMMAPEWL